MSTVVLAKPPKTGRSILKSHVTVNFAIGYESRMSQNLPDPAATLFVRAQGLNASAQALLIDFLSVDLDLAFTFLQTAAIEADSDPAHCRAAFQKAVVAFGSIRRFQEHIEDPKQRQQIRDRTDELKAAFHSFQAPRG
jgi:hypothetical protein